MPGDFNNAQIDFSALQQIGTIDDRLRMRGLRNQFSSGGFNGPNGELDYAKMVQAIGAADPVLGARLAQSQTITPYQNEMLGLKRQELDQRQQGGGLTPYQQQSLGIQNERLKLSQESQQKLPPNTAGALAMMQTGQQELDKPVSDDPQAATARVILGDPTVWSQGQQAQSFMPEVMSFFGQSDVVNAQAAVRTNVEAALRMMTGAAAPEQEVERYAAMFTPTWNDTKARAEAKLRRLDEFTQLAQTLATQGRGAQPTPVNEQATPQSAPIPRRVPTMNVSPNGAMTPTQAGVAPPVTTDMPQIPAAVGKARQAMELGHPPEAIQQALIADGVSPEIVQQIMQAIAQGPGQ